MTLMLANIIAVSGSMESVNRTTKLNALIARTRGFRKGSVPSWRAFLAENLVMFNDLGFPQSSQSLLKMDGYASSDSIDLTEAILAFGVFKGAVACIESANFAGCDKTMTLKSIDTSIALWQEFPTENLDDHGQGQVAQVLNAAEQLRAFVAKAGIKKERQSRIWCLEFQRVSAGLIEHINSFSTDLRNLIAESVAAHVDQCLDVGGKVRLFKAVVSQLVRLELLMLEFDAAVFKRFKQQQSVDLHLVLPVKWLIDMLRCLMTGFMVMLPHYNTTWAEYQAAHAESKESNERLLNGKGMSRDVETCWGLWRRELIARLMIISKLRAIL